jgi:LacI family gluconate utilization system Gnt-I transcriptional repressor
MTVSRVLKAPGKVADETRARVQAAIETLGYVPDGVAGSLASRQSRLVAALISTVAGSVFVSTIDGLTRRWRKPGTSFSGTTEYSPESEEALLAAILGRRPDGLVLTSADHTEATRRMLANARLPVVELWDLPDAPIDAAVGFSNRAAGAAMTRLLVELGYRKIAFVGAFGEGDRRGQLRYAGYESVLSEFSLGPARRVATEAGTNLVESGAAAAAATLECWPDTDAIFCASDALALER